MHRGRVQQIVTKDVNRLWRLRRSGGTDWRGWHGRSSRQDRIRVGPGIKLSSGCHRRCGWCRVSGCDRCHRSGIQRSVRHQRFFVFVRLKQQRGRGLQWWQHRRRSCRNRHRGGGVEETVTCEVTAVITLSGATHKLRIKQTLRSWVCTGTGIGRSGEICILKGVEGARSRQRSVQRGKPI